MNTSQFTSNFWNIYIAIIVVVSFLGLAWLLISQNRFKVPVRDKDGGVQTMGHSWDDIEEYNNPLPRWWFWLFVLTVLFSVVYLVLYPGLGDYKGLFGWTSHQQYQSEVQAAEKEYGPLYAKFAQMPVEKMAKDSQAMGIGKNLFNTYCIQCHGSDAKGSKGFPNLTDHDWLWGGSPEQIKQSISGGRIGVMPAWGPILGAEGVKDVANYVFSLSGRPFDAERAKRGDAIFHGPPANCFTCHGSQGQGNQGLAPNLADNVWLWGSTDKSIVDVITNGRNSQMPSWSGFLTNDQIAILTGYVWSQSNQ